MTQPIEPQRVRLSRVSLALRVLVISIVVIALPLLIFFFYVYEREYSSRLEAIASRLHELGSSRAELMTQLTRHDLRIIDIIEQIIATDNPDHTQLNSLLADVAKGGGYADVYYVSLTSDTRYQVVAASDPTFVGTELGDERYIEQVVVDGETSFLAHGASLDVPTATFKKYFYVAKLVDGDLGILTLQTGVNELVEVIIAPVESPYPIQFSLVTGEGVIFTSSEQNLILRSIKPFQEPSEVAFKPIKGLPGAKLVDWAGAEQIVVTVPIEGTDLTLLLSAQKSLVFKPLRNRIWHVIGVFVLIFVVGGWAALWLTLRMSRPLAHLCDVMKRVSGGDLTARYRKGRSGFEVNMIGAIFNDTIDSLRAQMARAETERVRRESLDEEFRIGRDIQMTILPVIPPSLMGVSLAARYFPAKQVGGDFYDIFFLESPDGTGKDLVLTVADASGKGISACLYSLLLRSMLRSFVVTYGRVSEGLRHANNLFCDDTGDTGMFVTALTAIYHPDTRRLSYTSCGHLPGLVRRKDGSVDYLSGRSMAMGILPMETLEEDETQLASGDLLVLYSDGITEAQDAQRELYGEKRLIAYLQKEGDRPVEAVADGILTDVDVFCGNAAQTDDITLLLLRVE